MNALSESKIKMFGAYCAIFYILLVLGGWAVVAGFIPPTSPSLGAEEVASIFRNDTTRIRIGMVIVMWSAFFFIPFAALVAHYLRRLEGGLGVLTGTALLGGVGNMVLTFYPAVWWLTAAYRPDRPAESIYLFNDMSWLQFIGGVSMYDALPFACAIAAFVDKSPNPVFPRWMGYFNIMVMLLIMPDQLLFFFHGGVFSWEGIFGLWLPVAMFTLWFLVTFAVLRKAILRERPAGA